MPSGTAIRIAIITATMVSASVCIVLFHWPMLTTSNSPMAEPMASFQPLASQAMAAITMMITQNGGAVKIHSAPL